MHATLQSERNETLHYH